MQKQNDEYIFPFPAESNFEKHNASRLISSPSQNKPTKSAVHLSIQTKDAEVFFCSRNKHSLRNDFPFMTA